MENKHNNNFSNNDIMDIINDKKVGDVKIREEITNLASNRIKLYDKEIIIENEINALKREKKTITSKINALKREKIDMNELINKCIVFEDLLMEKSIEDRLNVKVGQIIIDDLYYLNVDQIYYIIEKLFKKDIYIFRISYQYRNNNHNFIDDIKKIIDIWKKEKDMYCNNCLSIFHNDSECYDKKSTYI